MRRKPLILTWTAVAAVLGLALALRYLLVEPHAMGHLCDLGDGPWWCYFRLAVILTFSIGGLGFVSLGAGIVSLFRRSRTAAVAAMLVGTAGLVLYNADSAAIGFLLGMIQLARLAPRHPAPAA